MVMPGDNLTLSVRLIAPIAMDEGLRFAIREGGRTVGSGVVSKITKNIGRAPAEIGFSRRPVFRISGPLSPRFISWGRVGGWSSWSFCSALRIGKRTWTPRILPHSPQSLRPSRARSGNRRNR
jgi:hypothetical protein